ncbi:Arv1-like protein [Sporormia fimetaria CBS 119925]|uniref:Protein ARV n=1 Tax=Sporormia fimetaria CBS 119925 TaxID=1340428 RepID=A0A6A6V0V6_9PLEO|nr:Arv1-like protein [Sporormia fimetaria CBS 119925]
MPICIECRYPVKTLYTSYSKADDRSLGKGVRLTQCPRCKRFADKYVEHDYVILFINLVLLKPEVYRHLLFNRLNREEGRFDKSVLRLGLLLTLFDVYLTWSRIEKLPLPPTSPCPTSSRTNATLLNTYPLILPYLFFLTLVVTSTFIVHVIIRTLCSISHYSRFGRNQTSMRKVWGMLLPYYPHPTRISTALFISSSTKLFPLAMMIWNYDLPSAATAVSWAVIVNNIAALEILMDCGYLKAGVLVGVAAVARRVVAGGLLWVAGLGTGEGEGVVGLGF